jgi:preprotein translocase subunit SecF
LFRIIKNANFDFMRHRKVLLTVSLVVTLVSVGVLVGFGLNKGIEFTGGTQLQYQFAEKPDIARIRESLTAAGLSGQQVTTIGEEKANEIVIRLASAGDAKEDEMQGEVALGALAKQFGVVGGSASDLNVIDAAKLAERLVGVSGGLEPAKVMAEAILEKRKEGILTSFEQLSALPALSAAAVDVLRADMTIGPFSQRKRSYVGPAVGKELIGKTLAAIVGSLVGMLLYIWVRFQLQWGFAAVVALAHDTMITLGLFALFRQEMSLAVVAAFLTLVGYSVNDTVVVFDRIRENLRNRGSESIKDTINRSINQTLSRTLITSGLTWIVVVSLYIFGGPPLRPFAFVLTIGVLVGTYSSIFVASPFLVLWSEFLSKRRDTTATKVPIRGSAG